MYTWPCVESFHFRETREMMNTKPSESERERDNFWADIGDHEGGVEAIK